MTEHRPAAYREAAHKVVTVLRGEWAIPVLATLAPGRHQYNDLLKKINEAEAHLDWQSHQRPLTRKVFSQTLKNLHRDGLIDRTLREQAFEPVWYWLTPMGHEFLRTIAHLAKLGLRYGDQIDEARAHFDAAIQHDPAPSDDRAKPAMP